MITREQLIRETRARGASWPALVVVYGMIMATMILSAMAMT